MRRYDNSSVPHQLSSCQAGTSHGLGPHAGFPESCIGGGLVQLQRLHGNRFVQGLVKSGNFLLAGQPQLLQRAPGKPAKDAGQAPTSVPQGPFQQVFVVRDQKLHLGGTMVEDLDDLKHKLMATKLTGEWTLVISMHGSEDRLGAQSPPDWQKNAKFYTAQNIEQLFGKDRAFVKWREQFGPSHLSMASCQVSLSFERTLLTNLTRAGSGGRQSAQGLGENCKPIATAQSLTNAPKTWAEYQKLPQSERDSIFRSLKALNDKWGYYGAPPVPEDEILHYYYEEEPKGEWVQVEVMVGKSHEVSGLKKTGIAYWNRATGPDSVQFLKLCDLGLGKMHEHVPTAPPDPDE